MFFLTSKHQVVRTNADEGEPRACRYVVKEQFPKSSGYCKPNS